MKERITNNTFFVGLVVSVCVAVCVGLLQRAGVATDVALAIAIGAADCFLIATLRESRRLSKRTAGLALLGGALGLAYFLLTYGGQKVSFAGSPSDYVYYFLYGTILAPFFEEAILRRLMFFGVAKWVGFVESGLFVSIIFAVTHWDIIVYAFAFSVLTCVLAYRGVHTVDRTIMHGAHNLVLQLLFVHGGLQ